MPPPPGANTFGSIYKGFGERRSHMGEGIFAEVRVRGPASCRLPVEGADATIDSITRATIPDESGTVTEEFTVESADSAAAVETDAELQRVFDAESGTVYRFDREQRGCVCDRIERFGCPVRSVDVREGAIVLTFFAADVGTLRDVIADLNGRFESVGVRRLLRSDPDESEHDLVFVDRGALTDRQREVLSVAHEMGYFDHPRETNAETVAAALDVTGSTFAEHLAAAQSKLMDSILDDRS